MQRIVTWLLALVIGSPLRYSRTSSKKWIPLIKTRFLTTKLLTETSASFMFTARISIVEMHINLEERDSVR
jgi:hypothetical protein